MTQISSAEVQATLENLEQLRKELLGKGLKQGFIVLAVCMAAAMVMYLTAPGSEGMAMLLAIVGVVLLPVCAGSKNREFSMRYKQEVIAPVISELCARSRYSPCEGIGRDEFVASGLFARPDRFHSEDLIEGVIGNTPFRFSEVRAEEQRTRTNGKSVQTYYVDIFRGFIFIADFHKHFSGYTRVERDRTIKFNLGSGLRRVRLEDIAFENYFDVYSTDETEARYILTPLMMERFVGLERRFGGVQAAFSDSCVIIAIPDSTDHFEASVWRSVAGGRKLESEISTLRSLLSIVDQLDLNTRIWTKE